MKPEQPRISLTCGSLRAAIFLLCAAACPADNPSSCGYIGWNDASVDTGGASASTTVGDLTASSDPPTTTETGTTSPSDSDDTVGVESTDTGAPSECVEGEDDLALLLGIVAPLTKEHGIFVHPTNGDDSGDGTPSSPMATLQKAIDATTGDRHIVFLCTENADLESEFIVASEMPGPVVVKEGVSIVGGMLCPEGEWSFPKFVRRTRISALEGVGIRATPGAAPPLLARIDVHVTAKVSDMNEAPDAQYGDTDLDRSGASAIGVIIDSGALDLYEVKISTDSARPGKHGSSFHDVPALALGAASAMPGQCSGVENNCGDCPELLCDNGQPPAAGGAGGKGGGVGGDGGAGEPGEMVEGGGQHGFGGKPVDVVCSPVSEGTPGMKGPLITDDGIWGPINVPFGSLSIDGYFAQAGLDGLHGANGGGGGGGGGLKGPLSDPIPCSFPEVYRAASGGGGGGGGCGGRGGVGGGSGGSSIAVVSLNSAVRIFDSQLFTGNGGAGGNAGGRQFGAAGAKGALGAEGTCGGGDGGDGRDGRFAGAGMGGHSVAVAYVGAKPLLCGDAAIQIGEGGAGGEPEADAPNEQKELLRGKPGEQETSLKFCPPAPEPCE